MSAFEVSATHIDALLTAGLAWSRPPDSPLRWMVDMQSHPDYERAFQAGEPWGPACSRVVDDCRRELTPDTAGGVGAMLVAQNRASVDFRYDESEIEAPYLFTKLRTNGRPDPVVIFGALGCYEYQACETPDWRASEAYAFCDALRRAAIEEVVTLLGGRSAWEITDPDVFCQATAATPAANRKDQS